MSEKPYPHKETLSKMLDELGPAMLICSEAAVKLVNKEDDPEQRDRLLYVAHTLNSMLETIGKMSMHIQDDTDFDKLLRVKVSHAANKQTPSSDSSETHRWN